MSSEPGCCELQKLSPEEADKIMDLLERMSSGKPAGWKSRARPVDQSVRFCPYFSGSETADECRNGCRLKAIIDDSADF